MNGATFERVQEVAADVFNVPKDCIAGQSSPQNIDGWDSVQHLNLVLALEQRFAVQFPPEEIVQMKSIGDIVGLVEKRLQDTGKS